MLNIIPKRKIFFTLSSILVLVSLFSLAFWGLKPGIDFTGGSLLEVEFEGTRPDSLSLSSELESLDLGKIDIRPAGENGYIFRMRDLNEEEHRALVLRIREKFAPRLDPVGEGKDALDNVLGAVDEEGNPVVQITPVEGSGAKVELSEDLKIDIVGEDGELEEVVSKDGRTVIALDQVDLEYRENYMEELRFDTIGPTIGKELREKSFSAMLLVLIAIVIYIAWAFRKVSWPVESWKYGITAIIALFHDVTIVLGVFVFLGVSFGVEINTPFVAALLTILGYSVNDTIVVFDRIRENLGRVKGEFADVVNQSVNETITRSINTSITTLLVLMAIYFFGGESIKYFVLALSLGVLFGTYSSIFLASPLLVFWHEKKK